LPCLAFILRTNGLKVGAFGPFWPVLARKRGVSCLGVAF
jgi:hypothetical protein